MSAFHSSDYTIASTDDRMAMDDISLSSPSPRTNDNGRNNIHNLLSSSGASVASKFSSRIGGRGRSVQNSDLGEPLTPGDDADDSRWGIDSSGDGGPSTSSSAGAGMTAATTRNNNVSSPRGSPTTGGSTKSYISEDDPFHIFRSDLVQKLAAVDAELNNYITVVRTTDTAVNTHQVRESKKMLKRQIKLAESTLSDLETTVRVVEKRREKFPHITDLEIYDRRRFVDDSKDGIATCKMSMQSEEVRRKFVMDERAMMERRRGGGGGGGSAPSDGGGGGVIATANNNNNGAYGRTRYGNIDNDDYDAESGIDHERSETLLMMRRQDETLDDLDVAVTRVSYMADTIHEELETQNVMLKNLEDDLADAEEQLGAVMGKLAKLLKTKSKCQLGLILILSLVVLVLFFLVLYT